jgi:two-component system, sensor histidine kinase and response regulator
MLSKDVDERAKRLRPEIRVTLKSIVNMSNLAVNSTNPNDHLVYIRKIQRTAESLLRTIDDFEGVIEDTSAAIKLETVEFGLAEVLDDLRAQVREQIAEKGLAFECSVRDDVPGRLFGDPLRLGQILLNLTSNAVMHTDQGMISVVGETLDQHADRATIAFEVRDTGVTLSEAQRNALIGEVTDNDFAVTSYDLFGFPLVRQLIEQMGGQLTTRMEEGGGNTIRFTVVLALANPSFLAPAPPSVLKGMRALVVDDNVTMRKTLKLMLESLGFDVTTANSGAEAIAKLEEKTTTAPFEMVFMDWMMPGMDGLETSRWIIQQSELSFKPVIVMVSAYGRNDLRIEATRIGIEGFLVKPVTISSLQSTIMSLVGLK